MFIVSLTYQLPLDDVDRHLDSHVRYLKEMYSTRKFIASGRKSPRTGGVILSSLRSREELEAILAQDPFHSEGVAIYEITEVSFSMTAEGFENLKEQ